MTEPIRSASNPLIRRVRALLDDPARRAEEKRFVVEGPKLASEALASGLPVERALVEAARLDDPPDTAIAPILEALRAREVPVTPIARGALRAAQDADAPKGVVLLVGRPEARLDALLAGGAPLLAVAWRIQDPGNLGAILRCAEAAGADGVVTVSGGADPFHPRAVRASAGSVLRIPVAAGCDEADLLSRMAGAGIGLVASVATGGTSYDRADLTGAKAILLGNEGVGLPATLIEAASQRVRIPMAGRVESLNVAVSSALLLFEAARQRKKESG